MLNDMGILADSVRYYHDADAFTATNLYHVPHAGSYHCDETYGMQRNYLDICQMLVVDEGELSVTYRGETRTAGPGSLILLDCREPHSYHALTPIRMRWFHFAGSGSTAYTHLILNTHGFILPTGSNAEIEECAPYCVRTLCGKVLPKREVDACSFLAGWAELVCLSINNCPC